MDGVAAHARPRVDDGERANGRVHARARRGDGERETRERRGERRAGWCARNLTLQKSGGVNGAVYGEFQRAEGAGDRGDTE